MAVNPLTASRSMPTPMIPDVNAPLKEQVAALEKLTETYCFLTDLQIQTRRFQQVVNSYEGIGIDDLNDAKENDVFETITVAMTSILNDSLPRIRSYTATVSKFHAHSITTMADFLADDCQTTLSKIKVIENNILRSRPEPRDDGKTPLQSTSALPTRVSLVPPPSSPSPAPFTSSMVPTRSSSNPPPIAMAAPKLESGIASSSHTISGTSSAIHTSNFTSVPFGGRSLSGSNPPPIAMATPKLESGIASSSHTISGTSSAIHTSNFTSVPFGGRSLSGLPLAATPHNLAPGIPPANAQSTTTSTPSHSLGSSLPRAPLVHSSPAVLPSNIPSGDLVSSWLATNNLPPTSARVPAIEPLLPTQTIRTTPAKVEPAPAKTAARIPTSEIAPATTGEVLKHFTGYRLNQFASVPGKLAHLTKFGWNPIEIDLTTTGRLPTSSTSLQVLAQDRRKDSIAIIAAPKTPQEAQVLGRGLSGLFTNSKNGYFEAIYILVVTPPGSVYDTLLASLPKDPRVVFTQK